MRSTRIGDIGCDGPKLYSVSVESKTTDAGPEQSTMQANLIPLSTARRETSRAGATRTCSKVGYGTPA